MVRDLWDRGVRAVDVSGLGGTSWPRVEQMRAKTERARERGELLSDWGIPTAACVEAASAGAPRRQLVASGGMPPGLGAAEGSARGADRDRGTRQSETA